MKTSTQTYRDKLIDCFKVLELGMNGEQNGELHQGRINSLKQFREVGFPTRKHEEWKYTNIHPYLKNEFEPRPHPSEVEITPEELHRAYIPGLKANKLVFINGFFSEAHSEIIDKGQFEFHPLAQYKKAKDDEVKASADRMINRNEDPFPYLNTAFMQDGAVIKVPANKTVGHPVYIIHFQKETNGHYMDVVRNIISVGKSATVKFISNFIDLSGDNQQMSNAFTQFTAGDNSKVEWYYLQNDLGRSIQMNTLEAVTGRDSHFTTYVMTTTGELVRNNIDMVLDGENCEGHMYGLYELEGDEHVDNRTFVDHAHPNCFSNELYKGILDEKSHGVFNGKIMVRQDAQKTNAFQHNPNILLSDTATINTKPQLEIFADDVKCSHGATVGQLDKDILFYLRSRGLGKEDAKRFLVYAFAGEVITSITIPELKDHMLRLLMGRLMM